MRKCLFPCISRSFECPNDDVVADDDDDDADAAAVGEGDGPITLYIYYYSIWQLYSQVYTSRAFDEYEVMNGGVLYTSFGHYTIYSFSLGWSAEEIFRCRERERVAPLCMGNCDRISWHKGMRTNGDFCFSIH